MAITLALYTGWGGGWRDRAIDAAIRLACLSRVSHVELIAGPAVLGDMAECWSSSPRDGGVRRKEIWLDPSKWVLVQIDGDAAQAVAALSRYEGEPYDVAGAMLSPLRLPWRLVGYDLSFCSEIVAEALGWDQPWRWSPARMWRKLR